jgi:hypothetical protein
VDLRKDASLDEINTYVKQSARGPIDAWMTRWTFRHVLLKRAYGHDEFLNMAKQSRFGGCQIEGSGIGLEVRFRKSSCISMTVLQGKLPKSRADKSGYYLRRTRLPNASHNTLMHSQNRETMAWQASSMIAEDYSWRI